MNDKLDEAAKASCEADHDPVPEWDVRSDDFKEGYRKRVRATIAAVREPSEEMLAHAANSPTMRLAATAHWQAMIDALLAETEKTDA